MRAGGKIELMYCGQSCVLKVAKVSLPLDDSLRIVKETTLAVSDVSTHKPSMDKDISVASLRQTLMSSNEAQTLADATDALSKLNLREG